MRLGGAVTFAALAIGSTIPSYALARNWEWLPVWAAPVVLALIGLWTVSIAAPRRWARWGWAWTGRELHVAQGWLTRSHTIVPALRVQHIDVTQGPVERMFGVATLVLHTAGTANSEVHLPGIARETAERIRDAIRARLSGEPW